ncbi:vesicular glutamate transporter 1-like [Tetranychus urticae]|uniref:vesicular glutamate transporter 1-like n=1 Tax=Tetranychus urticae TaxID=32264 RepID=UPI000D65CF53|nr:vesicular glutamate transporter 1-like [Tetranychus urticae]
MTRSRGDSVVSIKSMINNVTRFRWFIFILSNIAIFSICVGLNSFSLTVVAMIGKEHEHTVDSFNSTIPKIVNSSINSTVDSTSDVTITPLKSSGSVHVNWSNVDKSRVLAASFWGILVMSLFGGRICELYGPRKVVTLTLLVNGLVTLLFPTISIRSFAGAYFIRTINGICTGIILPSCNVVVSRWALTSERTLSSSVVTSGSIFANLVSLSLLSILS